MNVARDIVKPLYERLDALSPRERVIIAVTLAVAIVFAWSELVMNAQLAERRETLAQISKLEGDIAVAAVERQQLQSRLADDPNQQLKLRLERYRGEIERVDALLKEKTLEFITPRQMVAVLRSLLQAESGLRLVKMESLPPTDPLAGEDDAGGKEAQAGDSRRSGAYLHPVELQFRGDYLAVLRYIREIEGLEWRFIWRSLSIELEDYPTTLVRLRLETLSQTDGWIGV